MQKSTTKKETSIENYVIVMHTIELKAWLFC